MLRWVLIIGSWLLPLVMFTFRPEAAVRSDSYAGFVSATVACLGALQVILALTSIGMSLAIGRRQNESGTGMDFSRWAGLSRVFAAMAIVFVIPFSIFCLSFTAFQKNFPTSHALPSNMVVGGLLFLMAIVLANVTAFFCGALTSRRNRSKALANKVREDSDPPHQ